MTQPPEAAGRPGRSVPTKANATGHGGVHEAAEQKTDTRSLPPNRHAEQARNFAPGTWVRATMADGSTRTFRFVRAARDTWNQNRPNWYVDQGAYGSARDDRYIPEITIASAVPAQRPTLLLTHRDPFGRVHRVGRYATRAEADAAALKQLYVTDVRIEEVRP